MASDALETLERGEGRGVRSGTLLPRPRPTPVVSVSGSGAARWNRRGGGVWAGVGEEGEERGGGFVGSGEEEEEEGELGLELELRGDIVGLWFFVPRGDKEVNGLC